MKFKEIYSLALTILLLLAIAINLLGLLLGLNYGIVGEKIVKIGVLVLYVTPLTSVLMLLIKALIDKDYKMILLILLILVVLILNIYYLGLPKFS